jgi:hypothetical protein
MQDMRDPHHDKNWRDLCAVATNEDDPIRLASLVNQILQVFEDQDPTSSFDTNIGRSQLGSRPPSSSDAFPK